MIGKWIGGLALKAIESKACPKCGAIYGKTASEVRFEKSGGLVRCGACGHETPLAVLTPGESGDSDGSDDNKARRDPTAPVPVPEGTRIGVMKLDDGSVAIDVPAARKSRGLLFFALFWLSLTSLMLFVAVFAPGETNPAPFGAFLVILLFESIGLVLLYIALKLKYSRHRLLVRGGQLTWQKEFLRRRRSHTFPVGDVLSASQAVFFTENYRPVYGIEIRTRSGRTIRFGSALEDDEKRWLVWELRSALAAAGNTGVLPKTG